MSRELTPDAGMPYIRTPFLDNSEHAHNSRGRPSTIFSRVDRSTLERITEDLLLRDPQLTFRQVHAKYNLIQRGVHYQAFRRFARRIRMAADLDLLDPEVPAPAALADRLPDLVAELLIDICTQPAPASRTVHRLSLAYRAVTTTLLDRRRAEDQRRDAAATGNATRQDIKAVVETARQLRRIAGIPPTATVLDHSTDGVPCDNANPE